MVRLSWLVLMACVGLGCSFERRARADAIAMDGRLAALRRDMTRLEAKIDRTLTALEALDAEVARMRGAPGAPEATEPPAETSRTETKPPPVSVVGRARRRADLALTGTEITAFDLALKRYVQDEGVYPGPSRPPDPGRNDFPHLYNALLAEPPPAGPGGRSAPYLGLEARRVVVIDDATGDYRSASPEELSDGDISKFFLDVWGHPYVYRRNRGWPAREFMHNRTGADIYSLGPDGKDQSARAGDGAGDDLGNW